MVSGEIKLLFNPSSRITSAAVTLPFVIYLINVSSNLFSSSDELQVFCVVAEYEFRKIFQLLSPPSTVKYVLRMLCALMMFCGLGYFAELTLKSTQ
ncbi:hypothetical protein GJ496_004824 [Pomphorhynchus laevis]|nr:hypothetical protein GJ496_003959 [Pomphorhynchus laevis]KAI0985781.1 hypothetical protein GJ496_004824 [Pomphorhynchus laevis]